MKEKKVVEIEERIPKLKARRKQRTNRRLILYVSIFFLLMLFIIYFQSSYSHVQQVKVKGNDYANSEWVIEQSGLLDGVSMWNLNEEEVSKKITSHEAVSSIELSREFLNSIIIDVQEYAHIAYVQEENTFFPVLETGEQYSKDPAQDVVPYDAPVLRNFETEELRVQMASQLSKTPKGIFERISEITLEPTENDPTRITLLMNDGFTVSSTIRDFSVRITPYPAVVDQLDPEIDGIVHMRMNPYFESFEVEEEEIDEEEVEGIEGEG
ncbi:cell division protein FtsQ/DivIB [Salipaludibacillus sp. CF4.18]|uniref:cell division protein FtsQ/DivIB n=1 Tax=Salipaludibacillus sp. CF4.18 TaxID=3373081 RepID=UPI003EE48F80